MSNRLLTNVFINYLVCFVAVGNILTMLNSNKLMCVGGFIISAFFTSFYSKNIIVILVVGIVISSILSCAPQLDGFETTEDETEPAPPPPKPKPSKSSITMKKNIAQILKNTNVIRRELTT